MKSKYRLATIAMVVAAVVIICGFSSVIDGSDITYEVGPEVMPEGYQPNFDASRMLDNYDKIIGRYENMLDTTAGYMGGKLESMEASVMETNARLAEISERLSRIEKKLGIEVEQSQKLEIEAEESSEN